MITEEFIEKILSVGANAIQYEEPHKSNFISLYKSLYGVDTCAVCPQEIYNKYIELKKTYKEKLTKMANQKWTIKQGVIIDTFYSNDPEIPQNHFTSANITDEIAVKLRKAGIGKKDIILADQTQEVVEEVEEAEEVGDFKVADMKAMAKEAGLPDAEWKTLKKDEFTEYLKSHGII
jgi:hypothetical protein